MIQRDQISQALIAVSQNAFKFAAELKHGFVGSEHFLYALSADENSTSAKALLNAGLDMQLIKELIETYDHDAKNIKSPAIGLSDEAEFIGEMAGVKAEEFRHQKIEPEHVLLAILDEEQCAAGRLIDSTGAVRSQIAAYILKEKDVKWPYDPSGKTHKKIIKTKSLDRFTRDLTAQAAEDGFDPFIGRDHEVQRMIQILSRRTKNNPVLIGEPGVGKTAIAEGLAQKIQEGGVPSNLLHKRLLSLEMTKLLAGTKYRGDFEERMESCLDELRQTDNIILFIDELHTLIGAGGSEGAMDAANILKPALGRGEIQIIGSTTLTEYRKHIEKDAALERRFQPVLVEEPSEEEALLILKGLRYKYEEFHEAIITDGALKASVELSARYIQDRYLPDKAVDVLDETVARIKTNLLTVPPHLKDLRDNINKIVKEKSKAVRAQEFEKAAQLRDQEKSLEYKLEEKQKEWYANQGRCVREDDIAQTVSEWSGVPVTALTQKESQRLLNLEKELHQRIIGQEAAVTAVAKAIRRSRTAIREPNHPIGSFLFLGPTGVGKTELAKTLAASMFQDEEAIIRVDMSEYMEKHTVSKFIGSPPGYVGYDDGGQLTEKVRRKPYSVLLFDEVEKAHPDVWNMLLQIMDDGRLTDAQGRTVNFKNTVLIMTSNVGALDITTKSSLGFGSGSTAGSTRPQDEIQDRVMSEVKKTFSPEFLNRLDDIIVFHQLEQHHILAIAQKVIESLKRRAEKLGIHLQVDDKAVEIMAQKGYDPKYGARPLRRTIQSILEDNIAEKMLEGNIPNGSIVQVTEKDSEVFIAIIENKNDGASTDDQIDKKGEVASTIENTIPVL